MRVNLVRVGNSKGVIIPAAILNSCNMKDAVDLQVSGKKLVIAALKQPRAGWFDGYRLDLDDDTFASIPAGEDTDEWQW
jgi:antitoxin MazE